MVFAFHDFLNEYWLFLVLGILLIAVVAILFCLVHFNFVQKTQSFKEDLSDAKSVHMSITIDLEEKIVEKYYLYNQNNKSEIIPLDEFYVRFDRDNSVKLKTWLAGIAESHDFSRTRRIEVIMYDNTNSRGVYLVELEGYNAENRRYFLLFKDISASIGLLKRIDKSKSNLQKEDFFDRSNERLAASDHGSHNFLIAIKCKEYQHAKKEFLNEIVALLEENIFSRILREKSDNEIAYNAGEGTFLLFSTSIVNVKKFKKHIKQLLMSCSGVYSLLGNKYNFTITLVAGYTKINQEDKLTFDKMLEAETAANVLINKGRFAERLQLFDENLRSINEVNNNKLLAVEKVITQLLFSINYIPIIKTSDKEVSGYTVKLGLPHALKMEEEEFMNLVRQRYFRVAFYSKMFDLILRHKDAKNKPFYFSFDFNDLDKVMDAYASNGMFKQINFYFCLEFSNKTMQKYDLISIEKKLVHYKATYKIKFGITYNTLTTIYLNSKIYSKADVVLLSGQLIEHALDNYSNESLLEVYTKVAASYAQEVIGLNVNSLAVYELLVHYNVKKVGGIYLTPYINNDKITDKLFLKNLEEIDNRTY